MRIKIRYNAEASPKIISLLDQLGVPYKLSTLFNPPTIRFYLYDNDIRKEKIESQLSGWNLILPELVFSKSEYENATWYRFMPKYDKIPSCESSLTYSFFCKNADGNIDYDSTHMHQIGYYRLDKTPRWSGEKCIWSATGNYNHKWFTNDETRSFLEKIDVTGLRFDPVIANHTGQPLANIYQIAFEHVLPEDSLVIGKAYGINSIVSCDSCREKRYYVCPHTYQLCLYEEYLGDQDVYMTQAIFGQGYGYHMVIGSKKFYRIMKDCALDKCFNIHPIRTIRNESN
ncbi:MAG: hypothetical protein IJY39_00455 [Clostridia bacterium]|nr:hypothetical protein [Clostridia bacterium]